MNYYTHFAVELNLPKDALDFAEALAQRMEDIYQEEPVADDELTALIWGKFSDTNDRDIEPLRAVCRRINSKRLIISDDDGEGSVNSVCTFIQTVLEKFDLADVIGFTWAGTCDKPDPEGFGGGAAVITKDNEQWINTGSWLSAMLEKMRKPSIAVAR